MGNGKGGQGPPLKKSWPGLESFSKEGQRHRAGSAKPLGQLPERIRLQPHPAASPVVVKMPSSTS